MKKLSKAQDKITPTSHFYWVQGLTSDDRPVGKTHLALDFGGRNILCGHEMMEPRMRQGGREPNTCRACIKAYVNKYASVLMHQEFARINFGKYKYVDIFEVIPEAPGVIKTSLKDLKVGSIFYTECEGELEVDPHGEFLFVVLEHPKITEYDKNLMPLNWVVKVESVVNRLDTLRHESKSLIKLIMS